MYKMSNVNQKTAKERMTDRIQTSMIMARLQTFFLGAPEKFDCKHCGKVNKPKVSLSSVQVRAGIALLAKTLPDLKAVEQTIRHEVVKTKQGISDQLVAQGFKIEEVQQLWDRAREQTQH